MENNRNYLRRDPVNEEFIPVKESVEEIEVEVINNSTDSFEEEHIVPENYY